MILSTEIRNFIRAHASETLQEECCGLIVSGIGGSVAIRCRNEALDKEHSFKIPPLDYLRASKEGKIIASYHSHPGGDQAKFSEFDKQSSHNLKLSYILYSVEKDAFLEYDPSLEYNNYIGKSYQWGQDDCFSLLRLFYKKEFNIDIPDFLSGRTEDKSIRGVPAPSILLVEETAGKSGWEKLLNYKDAKKYDCLCFDFDRRGVTSHTAIYLGNELVLHHPSNSYSCIENVNPKTLKFFRSIFRNSQTT